jgi:hypothetical protein
MISEHVSALQGVAIYPIVSMIICLLLFVITLVWTARLNKNYLQHMEDLPLDSKTENKNNFEMKDEVNQ